jgi:uncharacterized protein (TIGR02646 family)
VRRLVDIPPDARARRWLTKWQQNIDRLPTHEEQVAEALRVWSQKNRPDNRTFATVRANLRAMSGDLERCWYCDDSCGNEIEHVHPKSLFPGRTFVWENYLYACGICNSEKRDTFSVFLDGSAADHQDARILLQSSGVAALTKDPLILNPRTDKYLDYLVLDLDSFIFNPFPLLNERGKARARHTIDVLKLNARSGLVAARRSAFESFRARVVEYQTVRDGGGTPSELGRKKDSLRRCAHLHVWDEMKRQATRRDDLERLFDPVPEMLDW